MAVYVDDMYLSPVGQFGRMKMSHMIADTRAELDAMADRIGVARRWRQQSGNHGEHYDVSMSKRALAIRYGAVPITWRDLAMRCAARRTSEGAERAYFNAPVATQPTLLEMSDRGQV